MPPITKKNDGTSPNIRNLSKIPKFGNKEQKGKFLPTIGEISMDSCVIDLSGICDISVGDDVLYFGAARPIWKLANELNTIPYEIMATLSRRIKRIYIQLES